MKSIIILLLILLPLTFTSPAPKDISSEYIKYMDELSLFISVINSESHGLSYAEKLRTGSVVLNRIKSGLFPSTMAGVIFQSGQFKGICTKLFTVDHKSKKGLESIKAAVFLLKNGSILPSCVLYFHNPKTSTDSVQINRLKNKIYYKGRHHWYFTV